jgi:ABC-type multidrug transport system fused ATPase/permease subunit
MTSFPAFIALYTTGADILSSVVKYMFLELNASPSELRMVGQTSTKIRSTELSRLDFAIDITAENLSFYYSDGSPPALNGISFFIQSGERVAVIGRTGSGKSTLIRCLLGLSCSSYSGSLKLSGLELRDFTAEQLSALRQSISVVSQDPLIFTGSLRFNLDPKGIYSEQELLQVIAQTKLASIIANDKLMSENIWQSPSDFSSNIPMLEFPITDAGQSLSVGQRQLICTARVLLKRSKLIVVDEATSSIDNVAESYIYETLREHAKETGATVLCVCHKIGSAKLLCDMAMELESGSLARYSKI